MNKIIIAILVGFFSLCLLGTNPYLIANGYDNVFYYLLGKSLAESGAYAIDHQYVIDWPPLYPAMLATLFTFFGPFVVVGKIFTALCGVVALYFSYLLCIKEKREPAWAILLVLALLPTALALGTRMASDLPFLGISMAFFLALHRVEEERSVKWGVLAGLLLGLACLTRYIGGFLGFALLAHIFKMWKRGEKLLPEVVCATLAAALFLPWVYEMWSWLHDPSITLYSGTYQRRGFELWSFFSPEKLGIMIMDLFMQWQHLIHKLGLAGTWVRNLIIIPMGILIFGMANRFRQRGLLPSDYYTLVLLVVFLFYNWKIGRFVLCIAPFLASYFFMGVKAIIDWFEGIWIKRVFCALGLIWALLLFTIQVYYLFNGQGQNYGGLTPFVTHSLDEFYRGKWSDFLELSREVQKRGGRLGLHGSLHYYWVYSYALFDMSVVSLQSANYWMVENRKYDKIRKEKLTLVKRGEHISLYEHH